MSGKIVLVQSSIVQVLFLLNPIMCNTLDMFPHMTIPQKTAKNRLTCFRKKPSPVPTDTGESWGFKPHAMVSAGMYIFFIQTGLYGIVFPGG